jgi:hypothetical protein
MHQSKDDRPVHFDVDKTNVTILIVGFLVISALLGVRVIFTPGKGTVEIDFKYSVMYWINKALESKGVPTTAQTKALETSIGVDTTRVSVPSGQTIKLPIKLSRSTIVWVDDHPLNNQFERLAFASHGIYSDTYRTNGEALTAIS